MAKLHGKNYPRADLLRRVGNISQAGGIREYTYNSGRSDGVRAIEMNAGDFRFELLAGRSLDISFASHKGIPLGYHSKSGIRHPAYFTGIDSAGSLDNFLGGLLTTCGLHNIGPASECDGRRQPPHGLLANIPAEKLCVREEWRGDELEFVVAGEVRHSAFLHSDLILRRRVSTRLGARHALIEDEIENLDFKPTPCLILYHAQFGFPLLSEHSRLLSSPRLETVDRRSLSGREPPPFETFGPPRDGEEEHCFYHLFRPDADGWAAACLFNPELGDRGLGAYIRYHMETLPVFVEWRMLRSREYVCGLEPASARLDERNAADLDAAMLGPLEKRSFRVEFGVIENEAEFEDVLNRGMKAGNDT